MTLRVLGAAGALLLVSAAVGVAAFEPPIGEAPTPRREFRGVWVATVDNIDWPSKPGLPVEQQKAEMLAILDKATQLRLNAIVFQVRPSCDALYESKLEPWSEFLTGEMGKAPEPGYDPLAFAIEESHKRGLELHAWFNPYRARHPAGKSAVSANHISQTSPRLVRQYGKFQWMDPGMKEVQDYSLAVVRDVVKRYDLDGVHIDDYFYPYKEKDAAGNIIPFPDDPSWQVYQASGGKLGRDDWRRENVNTFVKRLYETVKAEKKWVKFGISPFGIWRPGNPPQIQGFDQYQELYADARKWLVEGWVDYYTPQLYWRIDQKAQSYPVLLKWWVGQNAKKRNLWPGNYTGRVGDGSASAWPVREVPNQIQATRDQAGATGNVHFSMKCFMQNRSGVNDVLTAGPYAEPALVPASPWLDSKAPGKPKLMQAKNTGTGSSALSWTPTGSEKVWQWVVRVKSGERWSTQILSGDVTSLDVDLVSANAGAVSAVDRCGNESGVATVSLKR
jgi:uncharacterized lipoprotein YddW (UPF0748 family)